MPTVQEIFEKLQELAPLSLQLGFDNSGFLVGHGDRPVRRVLTALDITVPVVEEAARLDAELIVSHHPMIFEGLKSVTDAFPGAKVRLLLEKGLAAVCMHTNLDIAQGGVNDVLIRLLGAEPLEVLDGEGCGRIGLLPMARPMADFLSFCKETLQSGGLRYYDAGRPVHRLAVMGGSGGSALADAVQKGCDTYLTADIKYHTFLEAAELGVNLIDADHFCTENPVIPVLARYLQEAFPTLDVRVSQCHRQIVSFY